MPTPDAFDVASHISAAAEGSAYSETVRFNNNDYTITMEDPDLRILSDDVLEALSSQLMRINEALAYQFTQSTGLSAHATLVDITAFELDDADACFEAYPCAAMLNPHDAVVLMSVPPALRLPLIRRVCALSEPYYERTIETEGMIPGWEYADTPATFFDNAVLTPFYAALFQMVSMAFDDVLPSTPLPLSLAQAKRHLNLRRETPHYKIRYSLMCDEEYRFQDGKSIISHGGYVEVFIDGGMIEKLMAAGEQQSPIGAAEKGIDIERMLTLYSRRPIQQEIARSSPYAVLLLMLLFDDATTTRLAERLTLNTQLRFVLKLLAKNDSEEGFVTFDEARAFDPHVVRMLKEALRLYGLRPELLEAVRYEQTVRVANIALKIRK